MKKLFKLIFNSDCEYTLEAQNNYRELTNIKSLRIQFCQRHCFEKNLFYLKLDLKQLLLFVGIYFSFHLLAIDLLAYFICVKIVIRIKHVTGNKMDVITSKLNCRC